MDKFRFNTNRCHLQNTSLRIDLSMSTVPSAQAIKDHQTKPSVDGRLWVFLAGVLWSLAGVWTKSLPDSGTTIAIWRGLFAGLALAPFAIGRGPKKITARYLWIAIAFATMVGLYIGAIKATTAANAIFLQCSATAWVVPIGWMFLNEKPDRRTLWGVGLAMLGIAWIIAPELLVVDSSHLVGMAMGLASGVAYACVVVGLRSCRADDSIWLSVWNNMAGSLILAAVIALTGESILPYRSSIPGLAVFGFLQMALPYTFFARGLRTTTPAQATLIALVEPILNPIWVWLLHGERPHNATIIGGIFMIIGVVVANVKSKTDS